jgi:predicted nucleic acid-binding protein
MTYLLDTNTVSQLRRPRNASAAFRSWFAAQPLEDCFLSVITLMELEFGARRAFEKQRPHAPLLRAWIDGQVTADFGQRLLLVDELVSRRAALLLPPERHRLADCLIAATALVHGLTLVTRNTGDFAGTGADLLNPWDG